MKKSFILFCLITTGLLAKVNYNNYQVFLKNPTNLYNGTLDKYVKSACSDLSNKGYVYRDLKDENRNVLKLHKIWVNHFGNTSIVYLLDNAYKHGALLCYKVSRGETIAKLIDSARKSKVLSKQFLIAEVTNTFYSLIDIISVLSMLKTI